MNKNLLLLLLFFAFENIVYGQTLFLPNGTSGISASDRNGSVGIGTSTPKAYFDVYPLYTNSLKSVLGRLSEGDQSGEGTFLGVRAYNSQPENSSQPCCNIKSFALEHVFYGQINSSVNFYRGGSITGGFITFNTNTNEERVRIDVYGNVGIGTSAPQNKLDVNGTIHAREVKVDLTGWSDFVFQPSYKLKPLIEVESFIKTNGHLQDIPSAAEVEKDGINLGEMQKKLLQKVEELTLYVIEQQKMIDELKKENLLIKQRLTTNN